MSDFFVFTMITETRPWRHIPRHRGFKTKKPRHRDVGTETPRQVVQWCSVKKVFLEISQNLQENTCARASGTEK